MNLRLLSLSLVGFWDVKTGQQIETLGPYWDIYNIAFSPDMRIMIARVMILHAWQTYKTLNKSVALVVIILGPSQCLRILKNLPLQIPGITVR